MFQPSTNPHQPSEFPPQTSSKVKLTQIKQSMNDLHHLIEQTKSMINSRQNFATPRHKTMYLDQKNYYTQQTRVQEQKAEPSVQIDIQPMNQNSKYRIKIEDKTIRSNVDIDIEIAPKRVEVLTNKRNQDVGMLYQNREQSKYFRNNYPRVDQQVFQSRSSDFSTIKKEKSEKSFERISRIQPPIESVSPTFLKPHQNQISEPSSHICRQSESIVYQHQASVDKSRSQSPSVYNYGIQSQIQHKKPNLSLQKKVYQELILNEQVQKSENKERYKISKFSNDTVMSTRNYQKKLEKQQHPKTVKIDLRQRNRTQNPQKEDHFLKNKATYLNRLRREQQLRTNRKNSRSYSSKRNYSLSPECQRITNRLHYTKINKQPCLKLQRQKLMEKMQKMQIMCKQHGFIRRYLSDRQILGMMANLEAAGVPEVKWPMKIIDKIYSKLKFSSYPQYSH